MHGSAKHMQILFSEVEVEEAKRPSGNGALECCSCGEGAWLVLALQTGRQAKETPAIHA
eukprot:m.120053 g.120053  ORF g.120053 m.120053 type:complete len:59 (+) comp9568_c0_seq7:319-495(+)